MVKATDLRIGNWVEAVAKMGNYYMRMTEHNFIDLVKKPDCAKPIPLTPEILDNLGERKTVMNDTNIYWNVGGFLYSLSEFALSKGLHWFLNYHYFRTGEELQIKDLNLVVKEKTD